MAARREKQHKRRTRGMNPKQLEALEAFVIENGVSPVVIDLEGLVDSALPYTTNKSRVSEVVEDLKRENEQMMQDLSHIFLNLFVPTMFLYSSLVLYFSYLFACMGF